MRKASSYNNSQAETEDLPFGAYKNESISGAKDGTNITAEHIQDILYSLYQILQLAGQIPNGTLEDGNTNKQFISSLASICYLKYSTAINYSINNVVISPSGTKLYVSLVNNNIGNALTEASKWQLLLDLVQINTVMIGHIVYIAQNTTLDGYLKCNGAAISRSTYSNLYNTIGTTFGIGDGSTTFNIPDLRGEFIRGWDDSRGIDSGRNFGSFQADRVGQLTLPFQNNYPDVGDGGIYCTNVVQPGTTIINTGADTRPRNIALLACIKY